MKHPRLILWYAAIVPMSIFWLVVMIIETGCRLFVACANVLELLAFRFELWAKYNKPEVMLNCQFKTTIKQAFIDGLEGN